MSVNNEPLSSSSSSSANNNKLRAEAPTFTPSFVATTIHASPNTAAAEQIIITNNPQSPVDDDRAKHQTTTKRKNPRNDHPLGHRNASKKKSLGDDAGGSVLDIRSEENDGGAGRKNIPKHSNRNKKVHSEKKNQQHQRGNTGDQQQNGSSRRRRNKNQKKSGGRSEHHDDQSSEQAAREEERIIIEQESIVLPLHAQSAFPSLGPVGVPSTGRLSGIAEDSVSSIWQDSQAKASLLYAPPPTRDPTKSSSTDDSTVDQFAAMGLQRLSSSTSEGVVPQSRKPKRSEYSSWNDNPPNSTLAPPASSNGEDVDVNASTETSNPPPSHLLEEVGIQKRRRLQWDMNKLRDKWWEALEHRKTKRNLFSELQEKLRDRIVDGDDTSSSDDDASLSEDAMTYTPSVEMSEAKNHSIDEPGPSPLEALLLRDHPHDELVSTKDGIVDRIIRESDSEALDELLGLWQNATDPPTKHAPQSFFESTKEIMVRFVKLDLADLLNVVLTHLNTFDPSSLEKHNGGEANSTNSDGSTEVAEAFMLAAELGHEGCLSIFLTRWDNSLGLFTIKDDDGNSVFHHCCRGQGSSMILQILLRHVSGGTKSKQQQLSKALLARNKSSQTALHLACEHGKVSFVEIFLSVCSTALLAKLLAMEDSRSQTPLLAAVGANASDVVMCLIMWRGNRNLVLRKTPQAIGKVMVNSSSTAGKELQLPSCPMVWAARHGNIDMIQLLLQFSDPAGKDYRVTESIVALLLSDATSDIQAEGCRLLVQDGGNPFSEIVAYDGISGDTAVSIAATRGGNTHALHSLVSTGLQQLQNRQDDRRKDPKLRQQPESFFRGIECKENFEKERALANALIESLYKGWEEGDTGEEGLPNKFLSSAVSLYMLGAELKGRDQARLHVSLKARQLKPASLFSKEPNPPCYVTSYVRQAYGVATTSQVGELDRSKLSLHSCLLLEMEWFQEQFLHKQSPCCSCPWLSDGGYLDRKSFRDKPRWKNDEVVLIADDGTAFTVHDSIVSAKSGKLASALRFATMKGSNGDGSSSPTLSEPMTRVLHLDIPSDYCCMMLQHIYHGSMMTACGRTSSRGREQIHCHELLELMLVAEEFLCFSLLQECEMRLLSTSSPNSSANLAECFCWSCARSVRCDSSSDETDKKSLAADCLYSVNGPSCQLTGTTVLDVLAVLQHLGGNEDDDSMDFKKYQIRQVHQPASWIKSVSSCHLWSQENEEEDSSTVWSTHGATHSLKYAAIVTIFSSFPEIVQSGSFLENASWNDANHTNNNGNNINDNDKDSGEAAAQQGSSDNTTLASSSSSSRALLLQMCLEELSAFALPNKAYERFQIAASSSCSKPFGAGASCHQISDAASSTRGRLTASTV